MLQRRRRVKQRPGPVTKHGLVRQRRRDSYGIRDGADPAFVDALISTAGHNTWTA
jgi:hypothetical protein